MRGVHAVAVFLVARAAASVLAEENGPLTQIAAGAGTDWKTFLLERPGMRAFSLEHGVVDHTYSSYSRGFDGLWGMCQWLDPTPGDEMRRASGGVAPPSRRLSGVVVVGPVIS